MEETKLCRGCHWFVDEGNQGHCRRYPPTLIPMGRPDPATGQMQMSLSSAWPPVQRGQWCGEWLKAEPLPVNLGTMTAGVPADSIAAGKELAA